MDGEDVVELCDRTQDAARNLRAQAEELFELTQRLERPTKDTPAWYAGARARVEARRAGEEYRPTFSCQ